jgi:hypothetical protein
MLEALDALFEATAIFFRSRRNKLAGPEALLRAG